MINQQDLVQLVTRLRKIAFYLVLNDPELKLDTFPDPVFKRFNQKKDYCLDGFAKQGLPSIILIGPPLRNGHIYMGIKNTVLTFEDSDLPDSII